MQPIVIQTIPHDKQRYPTVGDYFTTFGDLDGDNGQPDGEAVRQFRISDMQNADYEFLVMIHELIENHFVQKAGIEDDAIDTFDMAFEEQRAQGLRGDDDDPGDNPQAPYHDQHVLASRIERLLADALEIDWEKYNAAVMSL